MRLYAVENKERATNTNIMFTDTSMIYLISTVRKMKNRDLSIILKNNRFLKMPMSFQQIPFN